MEGRVARGQARESPGRGVRQARLRDSGRAGERGKARSIPAGPRGRRGIPLKAPPPRPVQRGRAIAAPPLPWSHLEPLPAGRYVALLRRGSGRLRPLRRRKRLVPGADVLADVAAEDMRPDLLLDAVGDRPTVLNRPV